MKHTTLYRTLIFLLVLLALSACAGNGGAANNTANNVEPTDPPADEGALTGEEIYNGLCIACHGADATGVEGLGKNLIESEFLANSTDEEMIAFIAEGRPATHPDNTTGVDMPPRGGNPTLTDDDLAAVVTYLRSLTGK